MSASQSANEPQTGSLARTISRNVQALMDERRISQAQLADAIGITQSSIGKRLRNSTNWTADDIEAVSIAFDVPVARLIEAAAEAPARPLRSVAHAGRRPRLTPAKQPAGSSKRTEEFGCIRRLPRHVTVRRIRCDVGDHRPGLPTSRIRGHDRTSTSAVRPSHRSAA